VGFKTRKKRTTREERRRTIYKNSSCCPLSSAGKVSPNDKPKNFQGLRHELRKRIILDNPLVQEKIKTHRAEILREHTVVESTRRNGETGPWLVLAIEKADSDGG
jgi:hypothetical protein